MNKALFGFLIILLVYPTGLTAQPPDALLSYAGTSDECEAEVRYGEDGEKLVLPCQSHQPCAYIVLLHNNEGYTQWEVPESEVQRGDRYICIAAAGVGCDPESDCECVPHGRNYNDGNPTRFCRCLKKNNKAEQSL